MKKISIIIAIILIIILLITAGIWLTTKKDVKTSPEQINSAQETQNQPTNGGGEQIEANQKDTIVIQTSKGSVEMINFYKFAQKNWEGSYIIKEAPLYTIFYYTQTSLFSIGISSSNKKSFFDIRKQAEEDVLSTLGIQKENACRLNIEFITAKTGDDSIDGRAFPLSFCPGN